MTNTYDISGIEVIDARNIGCGLTVNNLSKFRFISIVYHSDELLINTVARYNSVNDALAYINEIAQALLIIIEIKKTIADA